MSAATHCANCGGEVPADNPHRVGECHGPLTLTDFLLARIAEDDAVAREASPLPWEVADRGMAVVTPTGFKVAPRIQRRATREHVARHDPVRVLAECEAQRRIVARHQSDGDEFPLCTTCREVGPDAQAWPCDTLRALAAVHVDHPDFREEWRL